MILKNDNRWGVFSWVTGFVPSPTTGQATELAQKMANIFAAAEVAEQCGDMVSRDEWLEEAIRLESAIIGAQAAA